MVRVLAIAGLVAVLGYGAVRMSDATREAFDGYVRRMETQIESKGLDRMPGLRERALRGEIVAVPFANRAAGSGASVPVPEGLANHWFGALFIPGATVDGVRSVLQDYDDYSRIFRPDVAESKLLRREGEEFDVFLRLYRHVRVKAMLGFGFPVEFNSSYHIRYMRAPEMLQVRSASTRIAEVKDPKKSHTVELPPGEDSGYLWRLRSYWRVYPGPNGVFVECEAISLSRSVPGFVEKMVTYFTTNFPEESMRNTLRSTREAVSSRGQTRINPIPQ